MATGISVLESPISLCCVTRLLGYKIGPVCPGVCQLALSQPNCLTYGPKIWWRGWPWRKLGRVLWAHSTFGVFGHAYWQGGHDEGGSSTLRRFHSPWYRILYALGEEHVPKLLYYTLFTKSVNCLMICLTVSTFSINRCPIPLWILTPYAVYVLKYLP